MNRRSWYALGGGAVLLIAGLALSYFFLGSEPNDPDSDLGHSAKKTYPGDLGRLQGDWENPAHGEERTIAAWPMRIRFAGNKVQAVDGTRIADAYTLTLNESKLTFTLTPTAKPNQENLTPPEPGEFPSGTYQLRGNLLTVRWDGEFLIMPKGSTLLLTRVSRTVAGRADPRDRSILYTETFHTVEGSTIKNGVSFDRATVDLKGVKRVVLPHTANFFRSDAASGIRIFMRKSMEFYGHSAEPLSIRHSRTYMGCAVERRKEKLRLATFGEGVSTDGGGWMSLVIYVPTTVYIEQRSGLSGVDSYSRSYKPMKPERKTPGAGKWHGPQYFATGWEVVPDNPDPEREAEKPGF